MPYETRVRWEVHARGRRCVGELIDPETGQVVRTHEVGVPLERAGDFGLSAGAFYPTTPEEQAEQAVREAIEAERQELERGGGGR